MVHSEDVSSLISDSGIVRYRLEAKAWDIFSNIEEPYWYFPEKIYVERFDTLSNVDGSIQADTAYYFNKKELWQLIGNVFVKNLEGNTFETSELFWDQKAEPDMLGAIYTDEFVRINLGDKIVTGIGMRANQSLTRYRFYHSQIEADYQEESQETDKPETTLEPEPEITTNE